MMKALFFSVFYQICSSVIKPFAEFFGFGETLDIFDPLANRLGVGKIKAELEDLYLRYLHPDKYFEIAQNRIMNGISQPSAEKFINSCSLFS